MDSALGLTLLRVVAGLGLMTHGVPKLKDLKGTAGWMKSSGVPLPGFSAFFAGFVETFGGLLVALGVFVPWVALIVGVNMLAALSFHILNKQKFKQMEDAVLYLAIFATLAILGGAYQLLV